MIVQFSFFQKQSLSYRTQPIKLSPLMPNFMLQEAMLLCKLANIKELYMTFQQLSGLKMAMLHITVAEFYLLFFSLHP